MAWLTWVPGTARLLQYGSFSQVSVWAFFIVMCVELGRVPGRSDEGTFSIDLDLCAWWSELGR